jgi:acyl-coenzyme A synthetase/AMP-(fatty) acid ligase
MVGGAGCCLSWASDTRGEFMADVASRVAPHEKIRRVEFVSGVPKSPSGKILRRLLVQSSSPAAGRPG